MLSLLVSITLINFGDFGIALSVSHSRHCKVHTDFGAFACKMSAETFHYLFVFNLAVAENMLANKLSIRRYGFKLFCMAYGAYLYAVFYDFTANNTFFHN